MGGLRGAAEFERWTKGIPLTRAKAVKAKCYECNGQEEANCDCDVPKCPLYPFSPYKGKKAKK